MTQEALNVFFYNCILLNITRNRGGRRSCLPFFRTDITLDYTNPFLFPLNDTFILAPYSIKLYIISEQERETNLLIMTIQLNNRIFEVEETGNDNVPFKLHSKKSTYSGMQSQVQDNVIAVMDKSFRRIAYFDRNTMKQLVTM